MKIYTKSQAITNILKRLRFPYHLLSILRIIPSSFVNYFYNYIAKNRYRFFGRIDHCSIINDSEIQNLKDKVIK